MHPLRLAGGQLGGHEAAEGMTDEVGALEADGLNPAPEQGRQLGGSEVSSQPRQVGQVDAAPLGQLLPDGRPPTPGPGKPENEHDRRTVAGAAVPDRRPVDLDLPELHPISVSAVGEIRVLAFPRSNPVWSPYGWKDNDAPN